MLDDTPAARVEALMPHGEAAALPARIARPVALCVRAARPGDLPRLTAIYNFYIEHTAVTFDIEPFTAEGRAEWFSHYSETGRHRLLVAEGDGVVLGYTCSSRFRPKRAYDTTVEMTIVIAPEAIGLGIGGLLYDSMFPLLRTEDIHMAIAGVTQANDASNALHERYGFTRVAYEPEVGRKFDRYWDVAWFQKRMD
jgi:phosphinothricin acetyltransferase